MVKRKSFVIGIVVAVLIASYFTFLYEKETQKGTHHYIEYSITPEVADVDYYVYVPILLFEGNPILIYQHIRVVEGNCSFLFEEVDGKTVMNLSANSSVMINGALLELPSSEKYFHYTWTTYMPPSDLPPVRPQSLIEVRGDSQAEGSINCTIVINYKARSNPGTLYDGLRKDTLEGTITLNDEWATISMHKDAWLS